MRDDAAEILHSLLQAAFVACDRSAVGALLGPAARVHDPHLAEPTLEAFLEWIENLAHAVTDRTLCVTTEVVGPSNGLAHFGLRGLHVGVGWGVVPVGRPIQVPGSSSIALSDGRVVELRNHWSTGAMLRGFGLHDDGAPPLDFYATSTRAPLTHDLLAGTPELTLWARGWKLSPFLARTAVLVMAGLDARSMAERLEVTPATVRTYVRELYRATGAHGRLPLLRAARALASLESPNADDDATAASG